MKKVFISVDIEGVAGIGHWDEADHFHQRGAYFAEQMSLEAAAAAKAAIALGYEVVVRDAHASARNMNMRVFPEQTKFIRGWSGSPMKMMEGIDNNFTAAIYIGYHSAAYKMENPLSHTISSRRFQKITINGEIASEFLINTYLAYYYGVPVIALSGDQGICDEVRHFSPAIETFATLEGKGDSVLSLHPEASINGIYKMVERALTKPLDNYTLNMPESFTLEIEYKQMAEVYRASYYPGAYIVDGRTVGFKSDDFFEIARAIFFM